MKSSRPPVLPKSEACRRAVARCTTVRQSSTDYQKNDEFRRERKPDFLSNSRFDNCCVAVSSLTNSSVELTNSSMSMSNVDGGEYSDGTRLPTECTSKSAESDGCRKSIDQPKSENGCDSESPAATMTGGLLSCEISDDTGDAQNVELEPSSALTPPPKPARHPIPSFHTLKKPSVRPPPPPPDVLRANLTSEKNLARCDPATTDDSTHPTNSGEIYQAISPTEGAQSTPEDHLEHPTFARMVRDEDAIPKVPSIPPPSPPQRSPSGSSDDEMYEQIGLGSPLESKAVSSVQQSAVVNRQPSPMQSATLNVDSPSFGESNSTPKEGEVQLSSEAIEFAERFVGSLEEEWELARKKKEGTVAKDLATDAADLKIDTNKICGNAETTGHDLKGHYRKKKQTVHSGRNKKKSDAKRPLSSVEFDRLLRLKSDIQLNISKKIGQVKLKVSSVNEKQRQEKAASTLCVDPDSLKTDDILTNPDIIYDDEYIYGDYWSSDEDVEEMSENPYGNRQNDSNGGCFPQSTGSVTATETKSSSPYLREISEADEMAYANNSIDESSGVVSQLEKDKSDSTSEESSRVYDATTAICKPSKIVTEMIYSEGGTFCENNKEKLKATPGGYETVLSPNSSPEHKNSSSDCVPNDLDRTVYTPRILPDPQPLYQIYMMEQQEGFPYDGTDQDEGVASLLFPDSASKESKVRRNSSSTSTDSGRGADSSTVSRITSNPSMRRERLVAASHFGSQRSLWCELPEVINGGLLEKLDDDARKLQEAFFEVITSEASYLRSLNILITHFVAAPELLGSKSTLSVITNEERKRLFSNIFSVRDCSERLLCDLETRLEENLVLSDVCDILCEHFEKYFDPYVKYCSNQIYQDRTLKRLKSLNSPFMTSIQRLESDRQCQGLDMRSFLMLPMQRITRYPLLVIAILDRLSSNSEQQKTAQNALQLAMHVVSSCNEGARKMERTEQLLDIDSKLVYKSSDLRRIPLVTSSRYLIKRGTLTHVTDSRPKSLLQGKKHLPHLYIFLFNDILLVTVKKTNGTYVVKDYSARRFIDIEPVEINSIRVSSSALSNLASSPHLFFCTLMHNARGKQVELLLNAESESDRERWLSALRPPTCSNPEEKVYADWDCPQALAVHNYTASQQDELSLEKGDMVNILKKMPDGWFYGERTNGGEGGWFPSSYVQQILNDHVRAKNYRQRLRAMQMAAGMRLQQEQSSVCNAHPRRNNYLINRFRRLSNPKVLFQSNSMDK